ncbi:hypothetical protein SeMB42_g02028 [Synchytrium endobioticum]|uniref:PH domain-containing protein n=1 Tax=Synchytrium endobioticum TaxID=286115 RepID=A0A507DHH2_9FUNG|nr:hypothetical protein SeLEV6574_g02291 [Synchytrium endobioticum]TPX51132.1 hypothetical protein SeMB42_g02028 [Synchytrium endobioticum]
MLTTRTSIPAPFYPHAGPNNTSVPRKQGYAYKRGSSILSGWKLKFLILRQNLSREAYPVLLVFDKRDPSAPVKHEIDLRGARVIVEAESGNGMGFSVEARDRKYKFIAQTKSDRDEWVNIISSSILPASTIYSHTKPVPISNTMTANAVNTWRHSAPTYQQRPSSRMAATAQPTMNRPVSYSSNTSHQHDLNQQQCQIRPPIPTFARAPYRHVDEENNDAKSAWSDDEGSIVSSAAARGNHHIAGYDCGDSVVTGIETLSFCNEPVLTPQELVSIGKSKTDPEAAKNGIMRRRKAIDVTAPSTKTLPTPRWNDKYQRLLSMQTPNEDSALRKDVAICNLIGMFTEVATAWAKRIVDNYHIQARTGTMTPGGGDYKLYNSNSDLFTPHAADNGSRGPPSWLEGEIFFHFIADYEADGEDEILLAHKRASQELLGLDAINRTSDGLFGTPLMCLIDYKGFRIVAFASMPLEDANARILDLAADVPRTDDGVLQRLGRVSARLNLKPHLAVVGGREVVRVPTSVSMEVHYHAPSQVYYAMNIADLFPHDVGVRASDETTGFMHTNNKVVNLSKKLRPEFVEKYLHALSSDAHVTYAAPQESERLNNEAEAISASKYLQQVWIPAAVKRLDSMQDKAVIPADTRAWKEWLSLNGVNVRYTGWIAKLSTLPYIRQLCAVDMITRSCKTIFRRRMRREILRFKSTGATVVDDPFRDEVVGLFNVVLGASMACRKFWDETLQNVIYSKFEFCMDWESFEGLHRPALFLALQHHCGVQFQEGNPGVYDFTAPQPINRNHLICFTAILHRPVAISTITANTAPTESQLAYSLARHLKLLGPQSRLWRNEKTRDLLSKVSAFYTMACKGDQAKMYAISSLQVGEQHLSASAAISLTRLLEASCLVSDGLTSEILQHYKTCISAIRYHWGELHPIEMHAHETMSACLARYSQENDKALECIERSWQIALRACGKLHPVTAGYLCTMGHLLQVVDRTSDSIRSLTESLSIYASLGPEYGLMTGRVHYLLAQSLQKKGDLGNATKHAKASKLIREKYAGSSHADTIDSYRLLATLVMAPYEDYTGVVTGTVASAIREAIGLYEKVFRYLRAQRGGSMGVAGSVSGRASIMGMSLNGSQASIRTPSVLGNYNLSCGLQIQHPALVQPRNICSSNITMELKDLTKRIVQLRLVLVDSPRAKEVLRAIRDNMADTVHEESGIRDVVVRLLASGSPSVYLESVLRRVEEGEGDDAVDELSIVIHLTEGDSVAVSQ